MPGLARWWNCAAVGVPGLSLSLCVDGVTLDGGACEPDPSIIERLDEANAIPSRDNPHLGRVVAHMDVFGRVADAGAIMGNDFSVHTHPVDAAGRILMQSTSPDAFGVYCYDPSSLPCALEEPTSDEGAERGSPNAALGNPDSFCLFSVPATLPLEPQRSLCLYDADRGTPIMNVGAGAGSDTVKILQQLLFDPALVDAIEDADSLVFEAGSRNTMRLRIDMLDESASGARPSVMVGMKLPALRPGEKTGHVMCAHFYGTTPEDGLRIAKQVIARPELLRYINPGHDVLLNAALEIAPSSSSRPS